MVVSKTLDQRCLDRGNKIFLTITGTATSTTLRLRLHSAAARAVGVIPQGGAYEKASKFRLSSGRTNWILQGMQSWKHDFCLRHGTHREWRNYLRRGCL